MTSSEASGSTPRASYNILGLATFWMSPTSRLVEWLSCDAGGASVVVVEGRDTSSGTPLFGEAVVAKSALWSVFPRVSRGGAMAGPALFLFVGADLAALDAFTAFSRLLSSARTKFRFSMMWSPSMMSSCSSFMVARSSALGCLISSRSRS